MIKSMTGYGRAVETINGREFTVELRSVNNRYLDCTVKLPRSLSFAEEAVKQAVKQAVSRGKVDVFITVKSENTDDTKISLNAAVVEGYLSAMRQLVTEYGVKDDISVSVLSRMNDLAIVPPRDLYLNGYVDEEFGGGNGALAAVLRDPCDFVINMDSDHMNIVHCGVGGQRLALKLRHRDVQDACNDMIEAIKGK